VGYIAIQVSSKRSKQLLREKRWAFFHHIDESELHWIKAADAHGAKLMKAYGLKPEG